MPLFETGGEAVAMGGVGEGFEGNEGCVVPDGVESKGGLGDPVVACRDCCCLAYCHGRRIMSCW